MRVLRRVRCLLNNKTAVVRLEDCDAAHTWLNWVYEQVTAGTTWRQLRPHYTWGVLQSAYMASMIGVKRISVIEFGVAGGNGLLALDRLPERLRRFLDVEIDVYGFDTGCGLPKPQDYRDLPNLWSEGAYPMDVDKLRGRLKDAELVLGLVQETIPEFLESRPAPIGFIALDLDLYSSTMHALKVLEADLRLLMPRIYCYFDDMLGFTFGHHNGERLAISEFNAAHPMRQISKIYGLRAYVPKGQGRALWPEVMYMAHLLEHELYGTYDGLVRRASMDLASD